MTVTAETGAKVAPAGHEGDPAGVRWLIFARDRGIFALWAVLLLGFSLWASPFFASLDNAILIANAAALTAIFAAGVAVGIICGALDLSIPGTAAMAGCVCGWLMTHGIPVWIGILAGLAVGVVVGVVNGLITLRGFNPIIVTIGALSVLSGLAAGLAGGYTIPGLTGLMFLGTDRFAGIPAPVWVVAVLFTVGTAFLTRTRDGIRLMAVGGNAEAVRRSGINANRYKVLGFVVPHPGILAGRLGETLVVYYCIDDYAALPDVDEVAVARMDADLLRDADQVFVASARLLDSRRAANPSTVHAPHGVDVDLFRTVDDPALPVADGARGLNRPVIGFYGLIEAWIDLDLITYLAEQRPSWTFLLIGRLAVDPGRLRDLPNVIFPGPQPYASLPGWAKAFDVAIIPYRPTRQVVNSNPLKLREYLATGKPVVSVSAPEIDQFADVVRIARSREEFLAAIETALAHDSDTDKARRLAAVSEMSWGARISNVVNVVERQLSQKASGH